MLAEWNLKKTNFGGKPFKKSKTGAYGERIREKILKLAGKWDKLADKWPNRTAEIWWPTRGRQNVMKSRAQNWPAFRAGRWPTVDQFNLKIWPVGKKYDNNPDRDR